MPTPNPSDIVNAVASNLAQPRRARTDAGEVEQHELDQQVAAARFVLDAAAASGNAFSFVKFARIESPGATG